MKAIGKFVVGCLFVFLMYMVWALPVQYIWNHYAILWLSVPVITYWYAVGVTFFIMAVQMMAKATVIINADKLTTEENLQKIAQAIMKPFIVWGLAWIGYFFVQ